MTHQALIFLKPASIPESSLLGCILSTLPTLTCITLFLSPLPVFKQILKEKTTRALPGLPYTSMAFHSIFWVTYGYLVHSWSVIIANTVGVTLGIIFMSIFHYYSPDRKSLTNVYVGAIISLLVFILILMFADDKVKTIGFYAAASTVLFIFSPLIMVFQVCRDRSVTNLPFGMALLTFCNASAWLLYAWFVREDYSIMLPNLLSFISGSLQLACHGLFGKFHSATSKYSIIPNKGKLSFEEVA